MNWAKRQARTRETSKARATAAGLEEAEILAGAMVVTSAAAVVTLAVEEVEILAAAVVTLAVEGAEISELEGTGNCSL